MREIDLVRDAVELIDMHTSFGERVWVLSSGGKDSTVAAHIAAKHPSFAGVIHIRTKTGPASDISSLAAVKRIEEHGWQVITTSPNTTYEMLVVKYGFPGPPQHTTMYTMLKERSLRVALAEARKKSGKRVVFVTGIRRAESNRRKNAPDSRKVDGVNWLSPIAEFNQDDVFGYMDIHNLDAPKIMSRECLCGAFAAPGERERHEQDVPEQAEYWAMLEQIVRQRREMELLEVRCGVRDPNLVIKEEHCRWGHGIGVSDDAPNDEGVISLCNTCSGGTVVDEIEEELKRRLLEKNRRPRIPEINNGKFLLPPPNPQHRSEHAKHQKTGTP